jgi:hypothetical protein
MEPEKALPSFWAVDGQVVRVHNGSLADPTETTNRRCVSSPSLLAHEDRVQVLATKSATIELKRWGFSRKEKW